jgi:hypothetical protein
MDQLLPRPAMPGEVLLIQQNNMLLQETCVRLQNEQVLYAAWKYAVEENNTLNTLLNTLQAQMQELHTEIANLKGENKQVRKLEPEPNECHTDKEEPAKETEWILQRKGNAKKRKMDTPPPQLSQNRISLCSSSAVRRLNL